MKTMYRALLRPMIDPEVWYVAAISGMAERAEVLDMGDSSPFHAMATTMTIFRYRGKRLNSSSTGSSTGSLFSLILGSPIVSRTFRGQVKRQ
jgi:hypothetical protein